MNNINVANFPYRAKAGAFKKKASAFKEKVHRIRRPRQQSHDEVELESPDYVSRISDDTVSQPDSGYFGSEASDASHTAGQEREAGIASHTVGHEGEASIASHIIGEERGASVASHIIERETEHGAITLPGIEHRMQSRWLTRARDLMSLAWDKRKTVVARRLIGTDSSMFTETGRVAITQGGEEIVRSALILFDTQCEHDLISSAFLGNSFKFSFDSDETRVLGKSITGALFYEKGTLHGRWVGAGLQRYEMAAFHVVDSTMFDVIIGSSTIQSLALLTPGKPRLMLPIFQAAHKLDNTPRETGDISPTPAHTPTTMPTAIKPLALEHSKRARAKAAPACVCCKKAHLSCDTQRPCGRCIASGKQDICKDVQHKRRGSPLLREDRESSQRKASRSTTHTPEPEFPVVAHNLVSGDHGRSIEKECSGLPAIYPEEHHRIQINTTTGTLLSRDTNGAPKIEQSTGSSVFDRTSEGSHPRSLDKLAIAMGTGKNDDQTSVGHAALECSTPTESEYSSYTGDDDSSSMSDRVAQFSTGLPTAHSSLRHLAPEAGSTIVIKWLDSRTFRHHANSSTTPRSERVRDKGKRPQRSDTYSRKGKGPPEEEENQRDDDDDDDDDNDESNKREPKRRRLDDEATACLLACPFAKHDPRSHTECCMKGWANPHRLKDHLIHKHYVPYHCPRCGCSFDGNTPSKDRDTHLLKLSCQEANPPVQFKGVDRDAQEWLKRKKKVKVSVQDYWMQIYDQIFRGHPLPENANPEDIITLAEAAMQRHVTAQLQELGLPQHWMADVKAAFESRNHRPSMSTQDVAAGEVRVSSSSVTPSENTLHLYGTSSGLATPQTQGTTLDTNNNNAPVDQNHESQIDDNIDPQLSGQIREQVGQGQRTTDSMPTQSFATHANQDDEPFAINTSQLPPLSQGVAEEQNTISSDHPGPVPLRESGQSPGGTDLLSENGTFDREKYVTEEQE
ncbi:hypothetical protein HBI56_116070 [Parastagonospora nodorum]|uniref:Zn(2)-C6 fungal-type domain-containing protein n=1 Tax=Phaeosphaeria nodorum (strain SN15 / ATCC MYA-4574 / FGSC 10173) TaxID=321614 RepID=A0A7U2F8F4_PHANO|nr:hypothetical protein HBH56_238520 [Parastagonospora nodorum]QRD00661.1 hypothetical protein JI435_092070 [Parastagonospora nodorum SN15]KAH3925710.1 hypothetical protein HBH54_177310 [Parastagonospora nodorum]KAH4051954.1 hypothetical protein HBH49_110100 [Parastagonospora nodorum]KAH4102740.1 hypothetical protein HBH46_120060 [Parastagonospora nodorum]